MVAQFFLLVNDLVLDKFSSLLMTKLLLPWLQNLPNLLVELGSTSPEMSTVVADTLASAAVCGVGVHLETMSKSLRRVFGRYNELFVCVCVCVYVCVYVCMCMCVCMCVCMCGVKYSCV